MSTIRSFSSVSIRDYTDLGQMLLYLTCNQPMSVLYDPNLGTYTPNWSTAGSNLVITPVLQYNGQPLSLTGIAGLTITYKRKEGSGNAVDVGGTGSGESVTNGVLTVAANKLASISSGLLTYICHVSYTDPQVGVPIESESSMTFTLITQASDIKSAYIIGDSTFLYDADRTVVGTGLITLSADTTSNVHVTQWKYRNASGNWVAYPTTANINSSNTGTTLIVSADEQGVWINNDRTLVIKLETDDADVYDIHQIDKILDGVAGNATLVAQLSNSSHYIPCDVNGNIPAYPSDSWNGSPTQVFIYEGGVDVTSSTDWVITATPGTGLTGNYDSTTHVFTPTDLQTVTNYCDFSCRNASRNITLTVRYTITKIKVGADGQNAVINSLETSALSLNKDINGNFTPSTLTLTGYEINGSTKTTKTGRFRIRQYYSGSWHNLVTSGDATTYTLNTEQTTINANTTMLQCQYFAQGGTSTKLDEQIVVITKDGATGANGDNGVNGISMGLGNYQDVIPCESNGTVSATTDIYIPYYAYSGIQRITVTASTDSLPTGVSVINQQSHGGDATTDGVLALRFAQGSTLSNSMMGEISIQLTCTDGEQSQTTSQTYTWTKNVKAVNGTNGQDAVFMEIYSADGGVIKNSNGSTTLTIRLVKGATEIQNPADIHWYKFEGSGVNDYVALQNQTNKTLTVNASMVDDLAFFKATAAVTSGGTQYQAFFTVDDLVDPYTSYTFATIQEFKNGQGCGAVYTRVYQNGVEIDPIKSTTFSTTAPTGGHRDDYYYHLDPDPNRRTCILMRHNGTTWAEAPMPDSADELTYTYFRIDSNGNAIDGVNGYTQTGNNQRRCLYVDPALIDGRMQFICEVTKTTSQSS